MSIEKWHFINLLKDLNLKLQQEEMSLLYSELDKVQSGVILINHF